MRYEESLATLRRGHTIPTRRAMSEAFGGTHMRGISYKADGDWVVLVAGSPGRNRYNYKNESLSDGAEFLFFGEWRGCQDMMMTGGNAKIRDRSPNLYLFTFQEDGYRFEGRYRYVSHETRQVENPNCKNQRFRAVVFRLRRV